MPRNIRNFWLELSVDGKKTRIATGPQCADGGFELIIKMREEGDIVTPLRIYGSASDDGALTIHMHHGASLKTVDNTLQVIESRR